MLPLRKAYRAALDPGPIDPDLPIEVESPEIEILKADTCRTVRACLDQIPAHQKLILELRYYQDQSIAEIAIVLDVPENTVKSRLFQARKKLGEALSSLGIDGK